MKHTPPSISVMFPFLNDWGTVGSLVALAIETVKKYTDDWEVVIVNDGSLMSNREALEMIVKLLNENGRRIKIVTHEINRGYGGALRSGFAKATKDLVFYTDCDAQYDPRELSLLLKKMTPQTGLVNGFKIKRNDPPHRVIAGRLYHYLVKAVFGLPVRDTDCDFRLIRRSVFKKVALYENTGTICVELVDKINRFGYKISEVPVHHFWRTSGKSQFFNFRRLSATADNLFRLWWKLRVKKDYLH
ncbi:MAG: glycosyl transferase family 2 protein [Candidatus Gottesmanbacteria bacterium GW2011_GWA2_43_14]|uniref:Glycosyl transferase family 2 protein n=1 Tax=Candidatus Gottesmanbacteria bacterium GW2011_GWA2_43_14 TaxID=1618443 RepID=A0A0G1DIV6_9BACT|nr:MAG: glycosyl transferase family 2 protein [Candidatus Gottesmanbacteria bacterium GW2011_GWA2_43_14]